MFLHRTYILFQVLFFAIHIAVGLTMKTQIMGDSTFYWYISRYIASLYIDGVTLTAGFTGDGFAGQPNFIYPLLMSPFHVFHEYIHVKAGVVLLNSALICLGVHFLYKIFNLISIEKSILGIFSVIISGHLSPYTNYVAETMVEPLYYCVFFAFCYLALITIQKTILKRKVGDNLIIFLAAACVVFFYAKPTFIILPVVVVGAILITTYTYRLSWKLSLQTTVFFLFCFALLLVVTQQFVPVTGIARYGKDVGIYNFNQTYNIMLTYFGSIINLFSYLLFLPFIIGRIILEKVYKRQLVDNDSGYAIFGFLVILMTLGMPLVLSIHSVSHIEWAYPESNYYIFHERLYGYLIAPFFLMIFAKPAGIWRYISSLKFMLVLFAAVFFYLLLQTHELEPYAELNTVLNFSLPRYFGINNDYALLTPVFLYLFLFVISYAGIVKKGPARNGVLLIFVTLLLVSIKATNYLYVVSLSKGHKFYPNQVGYNDILYVDKNYPPSKIFLLMCDNRVKQEYITPDSRLNNNEGNGPRTLLATSLNSYKENIYTQYFPLGEPMAEKAPQSDAIVLLFPKNKFYFKVGEYYQDENTGEYNTMKLFDGHKQPSLKEPYPWIKKNEYNAFVLHPSVDKNAVLDFKWMSSEDKDVKVILDAKLMFPGKGSDGVVLILKKGDTLIGKFNVEKTERYLMDFSLRLSQGDHITIVVNKGSNPLYDGVQLNVKIL